MTCDTSPPRRRRGSQAGPLALFVVLLLGLGGAALAVLRLAFPQAAFEPPLVVVPFDEPDRLAIVTGVPAEEAVALPRPSWWPGASVAFDGLAAVSATTVPLAGPGPAADVRALRTTPELFALLRVAPFLGRALTVADAEPGRPRVAVLSYEQWQRAFAGAPDAIGRAVVLGEAEHVVVGVMPEGFAFPVPGPGETPTGVYLPFAPGAADAGGAAAVDWVGRLKTGVTPAQAEAVLVQIGAGGAPAAGSAASGARPRVVPLGEYLAAQRAR